MTSNVNSLLLNVVKLRSENWYDWKFSMQMIFRRAGVWQVVIGTMKRPANADATGQEEWDGKLEEPLTAIGLTIDHTQTVHIRDCQTGPEAWVKLSSLYERSGRANRIGLKHQLYTYVHDPSDLVINYITGITTLVSKLKAIGVTLTEEEVTDVLIFALAPSYNAVATFLMQVLSTLTIAGISATLIEAEDQMKKPDTTFAMVAHTSNRSNHSCSAANKKGCHRCGKPGHIARHCRAAAPLEVDAAPKETPEEAQAKIAAMDPLQLI